MVFVKTERFNTAHLMIAANQKIFQRSTSRGVADIAFGLTEVVIKVSRMCFNHGLHRTSNCFLKSKFRIIAVARSSKTLKNRQGFIVGVAFFKLEKKKGRWSCRTASDELFSIVIFPVEHSGSARAVYTARRRLARWCRFRFKPDPWRTTNLNPQRFGPHFGIRPVLDQTEALGSIGI